MFDTHRSLLVLRLSAAATLAAATLAAATLAAATASAQALTSIDLTSGGCTHPESVIKGFGGRYYVSCQNTGTLDANDGTIVTVDLDGNVADFAGAGALDNPRGLAFTGKYLVVTDTTKIKKIDRRGDVTEIADASQFPHPAAFFNDAVAEHGGRAVYVTEMGARTSIRLPATPTTPAILAPTDSDQGWAVPSASRVYRVALDGQISEVVSPSRKALIINGVTFSSSSHVLLAEFFYGNIVRVRPDGHKQIIATGFRGADGVEQARNGDIYVSSFENGAVWKMSADGENIVPLIQGVGFQSTADLYLDEHKGLVLVPDTLHSMLLVLPVD